MWEKYVHSGSQNRGAVVVLAVVVVLVVVVVVVAVVDEVGKMLTVGVDSKVHSSITLNAW